MTAYASQDISLVEFIGHWEIRSVNHRYLEINFKLPHSFGDLEYTLREIVRSKLHRGKVDCFLKLDALSTAHSDFQINLNFIEALIAAQHKIKTHFALDTSFTLSDILSWPAAIRPVEPNLSTLKKPLQESFKLALEMLINTREREGLKLKACIEARLKKIHQYHRKLKTMIPKIQKVYLARIQEKIIELKLETHKIQIEPILGHLLQKLDISEELDRFTTHLTELERILSHEKTMGRRLDFLIQELNREINTLASKAIDHTTAQHCIELKVLIEEIREQIQNLE